MAFVLGTFHPIRARFGERSDWIRVDHHNVTSNLSQTSRHDQSRPGTKEQDRGRLKGFSGRMKVGAIEITYGRRQQAITFGARVQTKSGHSAQAVQTQVTIPDSCQHLTKVDLGSPCSPSRRKHMAEAEDAPNGCAHGCAHACQ